MPKPPVALAHEDVGFFAAMKPIRFRILPPRKWPEGGISVARQAHGYGRWSNQESRGLIQERHESLMSPPPPSRRQSRQRLRRRWRMKSVERRSCRLPSATPFRGMASNNQVCRQQAVCDLGACQAAFRLRDRGLRPRWTVTPSSS